MPRYLITVTPANARLLESWLGGRIEIVPSHGHLDDEVTGDRAVIAGLDAVFDDELTAVDYRLRTGGPRYHAGGPG